MYVGILVFSTFNRYLTNGSDDSVEYVEITQLSILLDLEHENSFNILERFVFLELARHPYIFVVILALIIMSIALAIHL